MPLHDICQNVKLALEQVRPLKKAFDASFASALSSGLTDDVQLAQEHKQTFLNKMAEVRMQMHAWEKWFIQIHEYALTASLSRKKDTGEPLTKYELFVLYEFYTSSHFTLERRLIDWRTVRNHEDDYSVMFDEFSHDVAHSFDAITQQTQIYIGKLDEPDFFQRIPDSLEFIITAFSEKRICRHNIKIGGKDETELKQLLKSNGHQMDSGAKSMMEHDDFKRSLREPDPAESEWEKWKLKLPEEITLIRLSVADLGLPQGATTDEIYARAAELGLELCPPEVGPQLRLQNMNLPMDACVFVGMKQIIVPGFNVFGDPLDPPEVFLLGYDSKGLHSMSAAPSQSWQADDLLVFRLRKQSH